MARLVVVALLGIDPTAAQEPRPGTLAGIVVDAGSLQPLSGAEVEVSLDQGLTKARVVQTDESGRFDFGSLSNGRYVLRAYRAGYIGGYNGQKHPAHYPDGPPVYVDVGPGRSLSSRLRLWKAAVISGAVVGARSSGLQDVVVVALRRSYVAGYERFERAASGRTDDRGQYRIHTLAPGAYLIAIASTSGYSGAFYPNVPTAEAAVAIEVSSGDDRTGADFDLTSFTRTSGGRLAGRIHNLQGREVVVRLVPASPGEPRALFGVLDTKTIDGRFDFGRVPQGQYEAVFVSYPIEPAPPGTSRASQGGTGSFMVIPGGTAPIAPVPVSDTLFARVPIVVDDRDVSDVEIMAGRGARIRGRVVFDGQRGPAPQLAGLRHMVNLVPADGRDLGNLPVGRVEADGSFVTVGLAPGKYILATAQKGWASESVTLAGRVLPGGVVDLKEQDADVEIMLTNSPSTVVGRVTDAKGRPRLDASVYAFPADPALWIDFGPRPANLPRVDLDESGAYQLKLPSGSYYVIATVDGAPSDWRGRAVFETLVPAAVLIRAVAGQSITKDFVIR